MDEEAPTSIHTSRFKQEAIEKPRMEGIEYGYPQFLPRTVNIPSSFILNNHTVKTLASYALILALALCINPVGANIDCFKCVSLNGNNPSCEDPFHNNYSSSILESPCMGGRKGRNGVFPATACIKLAGHYDDTGETITVRGCALDSGTLTTDTEITRMSHCGSFWYDDRYVKGCLQSCDDSDGCNGSWAVHKANNLLSLLLLSAALYVTIKLQLFPPSSSLPQSS